MTLCFSLTAFRILFLTFAVLWYFLVWFLEVYLIWDPLCFLYLDICFLFQVCEVFSHTFLKYIFNLFSLSSPSGTPILQMFVCLMLSQKSLKLFSFFNLLFFLLLWFGDLNVYYMIRKIDFMERNSYIWKICKISVIWMVGKNIKNNVFCVYLSNQLLWEIQLIDIPKIFIMFH